MNKELGNFIKETLSIIVIAFILAMVLRTFVIEGRIIPSGSMLPTIQLQDRVMVNKFIYYFTEPQRGDIVVLEPPEVLNTDQDYIKRVIGLPGELV
jgi:signal peptidase I